MKKNKILFLAALILSLCPSARAELIYEGGYNPNLSFQQYLEAAYPKPQRSIIYIFTANEQCYGCPQTVSLIRQIYDQEYTNVYDLQQINYEQDREYNYIQAYNLSQPLEIVLVRVQDGETVGYKKLHNLQFQYDDPTSFRETFETDVNSYLGE